MRGYITKYYIVLATLPCDQYVLPDAFRRFYNSEKIRVSEGTEPTTFGELAHCSNQLNFNEWRFLRMQKGSLIAYNHKGHKPNAEGVKREGTPITVHRR